MGRGKSSRSVALIDAAADILEAIQPASVRAVCYQLFNRRLIASMAKKDTSRVSVQLRDARERGTIPWHWIVDETREAETVSAWTDPVAYFETVKRGYRRDRWNDQQYHVEVWSEKGTVRGTLAPVLDAYGVTFRVMHGYGSATTVHEIAEDSRRGDKLRIAFYVGDWDPSGLHMSDIDLPERIHKYGGFVVLQRVALTGQHIGMDLPSFALDEKTRDPRYAWFKRQYGRRCWELDALSPVVLRREVEQAIESTIDAPTWARGAVTETAERDSIVSILDTWPRISGQVPE